jgi:gliding motility associated protien GldN
MNKFLKLLFVGGLMSLAASVYAQEDFFSETGDVSEIPSNLPTSGPKEGLEPIEMPNPRADDIFWQKVVYRTIDLREKMNYPLYYPEQVTDNRQSLFTLMFNLVKDNKVKVYQYLDAREVFTDEYIQPFKDMADLLGLYYTTTLDSVTNDTIFVVNESDIPNRDVVKYYVKEVWYFDQVTSTFKVKLIALCPILYQQTDIDLEKRPLFWIPYDVLRPFLSQTEVLITDRNNGARPSFDDIFMKRRFSSYIFKESNIENRNLLEYNTNVVDVKREQGRIKTELINFENDLWEY